MKRVKWILLAISLAVLLAACAPQAEPISGPPEQPALQDRAALVQALQAGGAQVESLGPVEQPFLSVPGQIITVDGADVQVFEYPSAEALAADVNQISPDGSGTVSLLITWIAPPHFYASDRVMVLYVGSEAAVLERLQGVLGAPFAQG